MQIWHDCVVALGALLYDVRRRANSALHGHAILTNSACSYKHPSMIHAKFIT